MTPAKKSTPTVPAATVAGHAPRTVRGEGFVVQGRNGERREVAVPCVSPECAGLHLHRLTADAVLPVLRRCPATGQRYMVTVGLWTRAGVPSDARSEVA